MLSALMVKWINDFQPRARKYKKNLREMQEMKMTVTKIKTVIDSIVASL